MSMTLCHHMGGERENRMKSYSLNRIIAKISPIYTHQNCEYSVNVDKDQNITANIYSYFPYLNKFIKLKYN